MKSLAEQATDQVNDLAGLMKSFRDEVSALKRRTTDPETQELLTNHQVRMMTISTDIQRLRATLAAARVTHGLDGQWPHPALPDATEDLDAETEPTFQDRADASAPPLLFA